MGFCAIDAHLADSLQVIPTRLNHVHDNPFLEMSRVVAPNSKAYLL